ncbi:MAG: hypothetical protein QM831_13630 [Kofleriaceae bacterium]
MAEKDRPVPLFAVLQAQARPLNTALAQTPALPQAQSWLPIAPLASGTRPDALVEDLEAVAAEKAAEELAQLKMQAIEEGRQQGLAETAKLREQLATLAAELVAARESNLAKQAEAIAACAVAAIDGFVTNAPKQELFQPLIAGWLERAGGAEAIARVHPSCVAALQQAIGNAPIKIEADPTMAPTDLQIRSESLDLKHSLNERLKDLRDVIATAVESQ